METNLELNIRERSGMGSLSNQHFTGRSSVFDFVVVDVIEFLFLYNAAYMVFMYKIHVMVLSGGNI